MFMKIEHASKPRSHFFSHIAQVMNSTGNNTLRYDQVNKIDENDGKETVYEIPNKLIVVEQPSGGNEGAIMATQPKLRMRDTNNDIVENVGYGEVGAWVVTATIRQGTGHPEANFTGNNTAKFIKGWANFTELSISHSGSGYILDFHVSKPESADFKASSQSFDVAEMLVRFAITQQPGNGDEGVALTRQPQVEVRDSSSNEIVNTGWKGRSWYAKATLIDPNNNGAVLSGATTVEIIKGVTTFTDLSIDISGIDYQLTIETSTQPESSYKDKLTTAKFDIAYNSGNANTNPVFSDVFPSVTLREDDSANIWIAKANASDSDPGLNGVLAFSISSGDSQGGFKIDPTTGDIRTAKTPDLETTRQASFTLSITVADKGKPSKNASQVLNIQISNVNEFTPRLIGNNSQTVREDAEVLTAVGKVLASDGDFGEDGKLTYSIIGGNVEGCFSINTTTGDLSQL